MNKSAVLWPSKKAPGPTVLFLLVQTTLKSRYRGSYLGIFWSLLTPLLSAGIYHLVTTRAFHFEHSHFFILLLAGILPWNFFTHLTQQSAPCLINNRDIYNSVKIPLATYPLVFTLGHIIYYFIPLAFFFLIAFLSGEMAHANFWGILYFNLLLFIFAYEFTYLLAKLHVYVRDTIHFLPPLMQLWFYLTPILYPVGLLNKEAQLLLYLNPLGCLFAGLQTAFKGEALSAFILLTPLLWYGVIKFSSLLLAKILDRRIVEFL